MHRKRPAPLRPKPRVALIVETALASGRAILAGIGRYLAAHGPWAVTLKAQKWNARPSG